MKDDSVEVVPESVEASLKVSSVEEESERNFGYYKRSGKLMVVEALLKLWKKQGHRYGIMCSLTNIFVNLFCLIDIFTLDSE